MRRGKPRTLGMPNILRRLASAMKAAAASQEEHPIGSARIAVPVGWDLIDKSAERIVFRSQADHQQATISAMRFACHPTFAEFEQLCEHRLGAEEKELTG